MDYKTIMDEAKKEFSFPEIYENAMNSKEADYSIDVKLKTILHDKREFGLKKYGEHSFQATLENCMTSPTIEHAKEELIDTINYLLHEQYKNDILCKPNDKIKTILKNVIGMYYELDKLIPHT